MWPKRCPWLVLLLLVTLLGAQQCLGKISTNLRIFKDDDNAEKFNEWVHEYEHTIVLYSKRICHYRCKEAERFLKQAAKDLAADPAMQAKMAKARAEKNKSFASKLKLRLAKKGDDDEDEDDEDEENAESDELSEGLSKKDQVRGTVGFLIIHVDDHPWLSQFHNINDDDIPNFRLYRMGNLVRTNFQVQNVQEIVTHIVNYTNPWTRVRSINEVVRYLPMDPLNPLKFSGGKIPENTTVIFAFFWSDSEAFKKLTATVEQAEALMTGIVLLQTDSDVLMKQLGFYQTFVVYNGPAGQIHVWDPNRDSSTISGLSNFLSQAIRPLVVRYKDVYMKTEGAPAFVMLCDTCSGEDNEMFRFYESRLTPIARKFRDFHFRVMPSHFDLEFLGFSHSEFGRAISMGAAYFIYGHDDTRYTPKVPPKKFNSKEITAFLTQVRNGEISPAFYSQPLPQYNPPIDSFDGKVLTVVGSTIESIIFDNDYDVLLFMHGNHESAQSKKVRQIFEAVALRFAGRKGVVFAKLNGDQNELPAGAKTRNFPCVYLFRATTKDTPQLYAPFRGVWEEEQFYTFIFDHSYHMSLLPEPPEHLRRR